MSGWLWSKAKRRESREATPVKLEVARGTVRSRYVPWRNPVSLQNEARDVAAFCVYPASHPEDPR